MWKRILLVLVLALPVAAQVTGNLQHQINDLRSQLEEIRELLDSNNPIDLSNQIVQAYKDGAEHGDRVMDFVGWVLGGIAAVVGILGALGVIQIFKSSRRIEDTRKRVDTLQERTTEVASEVDETQKEVEIKLQTVKTCEAEAKKTLESIKDVKEQVETFRSELNKMDKKVDRIDHMSPGYNSLFQVKYEDALEHFERAIAEDPKNEEAWILKGYCLDELGRYDEAIEAYDEAIMLKTDYHEAHYNKGVVLGRLGRYDEAIEAYDEAIRLKPDYYDTHNNKGNALAKLGLYDESIEAYDEAIRIKPDYQAAHNNKGNALDELDRYDEAIEAYDEAIRYKPDDHEVHNNKAGTFLRWGATLTGEEAREKFELAKKSAKKTIEYSKGKEGHYNLACAQARLGELDEALESLTKYKDNEEVITADPWQDKDLDVLRKGKWRKKFEEIVGPPPEGVEEP